MSQLLLFAFTLVGAAFGWGMGFMHGRLSNPVLPDKTTVMKTPDEDPFDDG